MPLEDLDEDDDDDLLWLLGFLEEVKDKFSLLRHKFPSKVGGRPAWLIPTNTPSEAQLKSKRSGKPLDFLLQVYCPIDGMADAFHRTIFVFVPQDGKDLARGSVRAFRCQLPRKNEFYGYEPSKEKLPQLLPAVKSQTDPWRVLETEACLASGSSAPEPDNRHLFPEQAIVIDEEQAPPLPQQGRGSSWQGDSDMQASDIGGDVEAAIASNTTADQKLFADFAARVSWDPEQVLRYCYQDGAEPLWPNPQPVPEEGDIPPCQHCSSKRKFEFQVMPQLLSSLEIDDEQESALDWGTIAIYTCSMSCKAESAYAEEFVWVQP